jgi:iron complex outermembrane receptor protein
MDHNLAFKGGNENMKYRLSLGAQTTEGIIKESGQKKYSANMNVSQDYFNHKLKINSSIIASYVDDKYAPISTSAGFEGSLMGAALVWNPTRAFYKPDGTYDQFSSSDSNPLAMLDYIKDGAKTGRFLGNISATLTLIEGLDYKVNFGIDVQIQKDK